MKECPAPAELPSYDWEQDAMGEILSAQGTHFRIRCVKVDDKLGHGQ